MLFSGILSKYLTIGVSSIVLIAMLTAWYFSNENKNISCHDKINNAVNEAVSEERSKYDKLSKFRNSINNLDDDSINQWLQSNDGVRQ